MHLTIDHREQRSGIIDLAKANPNIQVEVTNLKIGDYIVDKTIVFERKTLADFLLSIKSGRFFSQSYKTLNRNFQYIIILEGKKEDIPNSGMKREAVQGALMHIALFLGIPVLRSSDINETLRLMMIASQQVEKRVSDCEFKVYSNCIKPKRNKTNRVKLQVVQNLPGIGSKKAKAVLEEFGTLSKVFSANPEGFSKIHGIRKKTASSLFHLINA